MDVFEKHNTKYHTPSPSAYNSIDLDPKSGRFMVSKFGDTKLASLAMKSDRFEKVKQSPGPSSYFEKDSLTADGKYILSGHKGNGTRGFSHTSRFTREKWTNFDNPGVGNYNINSDFGIYGDSQYYKTLTNF